MASTCRFCATPLEHEFVNLGLSPISNAFIKPEQVDEKEPFYPLHAFVCGECFLVQLEEFADSVSGVIIHARKPAELTRRIG